MIELVIWGAGGHGRVVLEAASGQDFRVIAALDDRPDGRLLEPGGVPVYSPYDYRVQGKCLHFVIAIGDNSARAECFERALDFGWKAATVVHPSSVVSPNAVIGEGTVVLPRAVVNTGAVIGSNCILNSGCIIEHDCHIGDHAHISPGAVLGGGAKAGAFSHVGLGACLLPLAEVGDRSTIGAGAVVLSSIPDEATAVGVPARVLERIAASNGIATR